MNWESGDCCLLAPWPPHLQHYSKGFSFRNSLSLSHFIWVSSFNFNHSVSYSIISHCTAVFSKLRFSFGSFHSFPHLVLPPCLFPLPSLFQGLYSRVPSIPSWKSGQTMTTLSGNYNYYSLCSAVCLHFNFCKMVQQKKGNCLCITQ